ncbi:MAG: DUF1858 domain-containing protein [Thermocrinis sp.]|jgi:hypothetical protein|uniref:DUF1858 domain-containing protein n=1 Tax=Thermocrinis sp. TaxID=2024383 RepID=UPI00157EE719|nr:DUF1858 domain-containing protein [Thermocrinis sp.]MDT7911305.1 DUF1858 domain-containing protein [Thermocrinis sp.]NAZ23066.1 DUF1858 domain-containing protein [Thermocrinis sp.]
MRERITLDINLRELLERYPETKEILWDYGLGKLEEEDLLDIVADKLTLKGFFRLMELDEEDQGKLWMKIQNLIRELEDPSWKEKS